jgi:hypothetical protein
MNELYIHIKNLQYLGTEFDHNGNVKTTAGEFSKHRLCVEVISMR